MRRHRMRSHRLAAASGRRGSTVSPGFAESHEGAAGSPRRVVASQPGRLVDATVCASAWKLRGEVLRLGRGVQHLFYGRHESGRRRWFAIAAAYLLVLQAVFTDIATGAHATNSALAQGLGTDTRSRPDRRRDKRLPHDLPKSGRRRSMRARRSSGNSN